LHRWYSANYSLDDKPAGATTQVMESFFAECAKAVTNNHRGIIPLRCKEGKQRQALNSR